MPPTTLRSFGAAHHNGKSPLDLFKPLHQHRHIPRAAEIVARLSHFNVA
jgi:hypothetical protein